MKAEKQNYMHNILLKVFIKSHESKSVHKTILKLHKDRQKPKCNALKVQQKCETQEKIGATGEEWEAMCALYEKTAALWIESAEDTDISWPQLKGDIIPNPLSAGGKSLSYILVFVHY